MQLLLKFKIFSFFSLEPPVRMIQWSGSLGRDRGLVNGRQEGSLVKPQEVPRGGAIPLSSASPRPPNPPAREVSSPHQPRLLLSNLCSLGRTEQCSRREQFLGPSFLKKNYLFIYLFMAALGLHYCARAFSSCCERGLLFVGVHGVLITVASLVAEHGL